MCQTASADYEEDSEASVSLENSSHWFESSKDKSGIKSVKELNKGYSGNELHSDESSACFDK